MKYITLYLLLFLIPMVCMGQETIPLKVLQINLWGEGGEVPDGYNGIVGIIDQTDPDIVLLCEIRNIENKPFIPRLILSLQQKEKSYFGESLDLGVGILSKYELSNTSRCFTLDDPDRPNPVIKATTCIAGHSVVIYSAHLDYRNYECYLPRGYSGTTWKKIDKPVTDTDSVLTANRVSFRDEAIAAFLADARLEIEKKSLILLGGDFNEPSHLDWQADTKDLWDHNGAIIPWDCSVMLEKGGFKDSYREVYPNAVTHPGFTYPSANTAVDLKKLVWAPEVDERDRIDFIYYYPHTDWTLRNVTIVGPSQTILRGKVIENDASDTFLEPVEVWPTDHKATLAIFEINMK